MLNLEMEAIAVDDAFARTEMLIGSEALARLRAASVAVFGLGGVGSYTAEALARCGVGRLVLVDADRVAESNINRQLIATYDTVGKLKVDVMRERTLAINPVCEVVIHPLFYAKDTADAVDLTGLSYIADCIDTVTSKLLLIESASFAGIPVISAMGAGNKLDPARFEVADIYKTSVCPLARVMRRELKARGVRSLKVVYSREEPRVPVGHASDALPEGRRTIPGSISFVPSAAGLILASEIVKDIIHLI